MLKGCRTLISLPDFPDNLTTTTATNPYSVITAKGETYDTLLQKCTGNGATYIS